MPGIVLLMPNKKHRKRDPEYLDRVARLGCIACQTMGYYTPAVEIHHPRFGQGMGQRADDKDAIGLCYLHHLMRTDKPKEFREQFDERELMLMVKQHCRQESSGIA